MNRLFAAFLAGLFLTCSIAAQRSATADDLASSGTFDGQQYVNPGLGLTILAPGGWTIVPYSRNAELVAKNRSANADPAALNTQVLFQATPAKQFGGEGSALFSAGIEKLNDSRTAVAYASSQRDAMVKSGLTPGSDIAKITLGNAQFISFAVTGTTKTGAYGQVFFVTVRKGVAIFFVETFYDNKNTFAVEAALKTLKFR